METLKEHLRNFKLAGMLMSLEERITYANDKQLSYQQFLELLCEDELNNRNDNSYKKRYAKAKLPAHKTVEDFDFSFQPSLNKKQINDALTCQFIKEKRNLTFIGNPGTGKTHLSIAVALRALSKNFKVLFTSVSEMLYQLHISKADNTYYKKLEEYLRPDLLVLDELGFKKFPQYAADDFFEVISKRYEAGSLIITTNKPFEEWSTIFGDSILAGAILDRIVHHSMIFTIKGPSYRSKTLQKKEEDQA
jgi:DNA replication protein DnaC